MNENLTHSELNTSDGDVKKTDNWLWKLINWINGEQPEEQDDQKQLIQMEKIDGTPLTAVKDEWGWWLLMGQYRLVDEPFQTKREAIREGKQITMWRIMQLFNIMIIDHEKRKTDQEKINAAKN